MLYLPMHLAQCISYIDVAHVVHDQIDIEIGNPIPQLLGYCVKLTAKDRVYMCMCAHTRTRTHTHHPQREGNTQHSLSCDAHWNLKKS